MRLFTNGPLSMICRPELQAGRGRGGKTPVNIGWGGTNEINLHREYVPCGATARYGKATHVGISLPVPRWRRARVEGRAGEHDQVSDLAPDERQFQNAGVLDHLSDAGRSCLDHRRICLDLDGF